MAEVVPPAENLATKQDLAEFRTEMVKGFGEIRLEIQSSSKQTMRWMLAFFVTMWLGVWGTLAAIVVKH
jgi:hypothetical protein